MLRGKENFIKSRRLAQRINMYMMKQCQVLIFATLFVTLLFLWIMVFAVTVHVEGEGLALVGDDFNILSEEMDRINDHIDSYCQKKERKRLLRLDVSKLLSPRSAAYSEAKTEARHQLREDIVRNALIYVKDLNQMWCLVPKAASTSWGKLLLQYVNYTDQGRERKRKKAKNQTKIPHLILRSMYKNVSDIDYERAVRSESVKKVLLIRHPFSRIVSAYENKLKNRSVDGSFFYRTYGVKMKRAFRRQKIPNVRQQPKEPTFEEFIEYLLHTNPLLYDEHWQTITNLCGMCNVKYDYVIKQEDLDNTAEFHLKRLGFPSHFMVPRENHAASNSRHLLNYTDYFANIPRRKMLQLFQIYQDDFHLFDYNFFDYYFGGS